MKGRIPLIPGVLWLVATPWFLSLVLLIGEITTPESWWSYVFAAAFFLPGLWAAQYLNAYIVIEEDGFIYKKNCWRRARKIPYNSIRTYRSTNSRVILDTATGKYTFYWGFQAPIALMSQVIQYAENEQKYTFEALLSRLQKSRGGTTIWYKGQSFSIELFYLWQKPQRYVLRKGTEYASLEALLDDTILDGQTIATRYDQIEVHRGKRAIQTYEAFISSFADPFYVDGDEVILAEFKYKEKRFVLYDFSSRPEFDLSVKYVGREWAPHYTLEETTTYDSIEKLFTHIEIDGKQIKDIFNELIVHDLGANIFLNQKLH